MSTLSKTVCTQDVIMEAQTEVQKELKSGILKTNNNKVVTT